MVKIVNLTLPHDYVKEYIMEKNRKLQSVHPIVITGDSDIAPNTKNLYYGNLQSKYGVEVTENGKVQKIQGNETVETFFESLECFSNEYQFIGYKLLINS